jgi:hypothetical protein
MVNHKKIYCDYFGYDVGDIIICEVCKYDSEQPFAFENELPPIIREAVDIHHLSCRASGGCGYNRVRDGDNKYPKDYPENLMAICREHHIEAEKDKDINKRFKIIHLKNIIKKMEDDDINKINW